MRHTIGDGYLHCSHVHCCQRKGTQETNKKTGKENFNKRPHVYENTKAVPGFIGTDAKNKGAHKATKNTMKI